MNNEKDTETKVVQLRFDNKNFEKNIKKSEKSLKKFDERLRFKDAKKDIEDLSKALNNIDIEKQNKLLDKTDGVVNKLKISIKDIVKIKIISNVVDGVTKSVTNLTKSILGINNVISGWEKYEQQVTTVGGILNNVKKEGLGLEEVSVIMDKLRWYTDETSFSFTTLSDGIKQFTTAGVELDRAYKAAIGVTSLAGASKVFEPYKVQSAMDAVSKSLASGYMDVQRWTSLTNTAGIVTTDFTQSLLDAAVAEGKLVKSLAGQYKTKKSGTLVTLENIRDTLSDKWLTGDVLNRALSDYSAGAEAVREMLDKISSGTAGDFVENWMNAFDRQYTAADMTVGRTIALLDDMEKAGIYTWNKVGRDALLSSQQATSWSQVVQSAQEGVSSRFQNLFELIFGNTEEATVLWSDMAEKFYDVFVAPFDGLIDIFTEWHDIEEGGYKTFRDTLWTLIDVVDAFGSSVREAFSEVFGDINAKTISSLVKGFNNWAHSLKDNETLLNSVKNITKALLLILKTVFKIIGSGFKILGKLLKALNPIFNVLNRIIDAITNTIIELIDFLDSIKLFDKIADGLVIIINAAAVGIEYLGNAIKTASNKIKQSKFAKNISEAGEKLKEFFNIKEKTKTFGERIKDLGAWLKSFGKSLKDAFNEDIAEFKKTKFYAFLMELWEVVSGVFKVIGKFFSEKFDNLKNKIKNGTLTITEIVNALKSILQAFLALQAVRLVTGIAGTVSSIRDTFWALEKKLRVGNIRIIASALLQFSVAMLVLGFAFQNLAKIDTKSAWKALAVMTIVIAELTAMMFVISKFNLNSTFKEGNKIVKQKTGFMQIIGVALALSIAIKTVSSLAKTAKTLSWSDIGRILAYIGGISLIFSASVALMRVGGKLASIWGLIKIIGALFVVYKLFNNIIKTISEINWDAVKRASKTMGLIFGFVTASYAGLALLSKFLLGAGDLVVAKITGSLLSIIGVVALSVLTLKSASKLSQEEINRGYKVISDMFVKVGLIAIGLSLTSKVINSGGLLGLFRGGQSIKSTHIGLTLIGITASVALMVLMFKVINKITRAEIKRGEEVFAECMALLLGSYALFVVINRFNSRIGMKNTKGLILSIISSLAVMFILIKLLNKMEWSDIRDGELKIASLMAPVIAIYLLFSIINKYLGPIKTATIIATLSSITGCILVMVLLMRLLSDIGGTEIAKGLVTLGFMSLFISGLIYVLGHMLNAEGLKMSTIIATLASITGCIAILTGCLYLISRLNPLDIAKGLGTIFALSLFIRGIFYLFGIGGPQLSIGGMGTALIPISQASTATSLSKSGKNLQLLIGVVALLAITVATMYAMKFVDFGDFIEGLTLVGTAIYMVWALLKKVNEYKLSKATVRNFKSVMILVMITIAEIVGSIILIEHYGSFGSTLQTIAAISSVLLAISLFMKSIYKIDYKKGASTRNASKIILEMILLISVISASIVLIEQYGSFEAALTSILSIGIILAAIAGFIYILNSIKYSSGSDKKTYIMIGIVSALILSISTLIAIIGSVMTGNESNNVLSAIMGISVLIASIGGIVLLLTKGLKTWGDIGKAVAVSALLSGLMASLYLIIDPLNKIEVDGLLEKTGSILLLIGGLSAIIVALGALVSSGGGIGALIAVGGLAALALIGPILADLGWGFQAIGDGLEHINSESIKNIALLAVSLLELSAIMGIVTLLPLALPILAGELALFYNALKGMKQGPINKISELSIAISTLKVDDESVKMVKNLKEFAKIFKESTKGYKENKNIGALIKDIGKVSKAFSSFLSENEISELKSNDYLEYISTVLDIMDGMKEISGKYKKIKGLDDVKNDILKVFGNNTDSIFSAIKNISIVDEIEDKDKVIETVKNLIDIVKDISDINIKGIKIDPNTGEVLFGQELRSLITNIGKGLKEVYPSITGINWNTMDSYTKAAGSILGALSNFKAVKKYNFIGVQTLDELPDIPEGFGEKLGVVIKEFGKSLKENYGSLNVSNLSKDFIESYSALISASAQLYNAIYNGQTENNEVKTDASSITVTLLYFKQMIDSINEGLKALESYSALDEETLKKKMESIVSFMTELSNTNDSLGNLSISDEDGEFIKWIKNIFWKKDNLTAIKNFIDKFVKLIPSINNIGTSNIIYSENLEGFPDFISSISKISEAIIEHEKELKEASKNFKLLESPIEALSSSAKHFDSLNIDNKKIEYLKSIVAVLTDFIGIGSSDSAGYLVIAMAQLQALIDSGVDFQPVIKPVFDFSNWDEGMAKIRNDMSMSMVYAVKGEYDRENGKFNNIVIEQKDSKQTNAVMNVNNNIVVDAITLGYNAARLTSDIITSGVEFLGKKITGR